MRLVVRAASAAALLTCVLPQARADDEAHWLIDPYTHCALFDANAKPGDSIGWSGDCEAGLATGEGTATFMHGDKQFESFTGAFAKGMALDGPVTVRWGDGWRYEGNEVAGQFSGSGVLVNAAKDRFDGIWTAGKMNGQGILIRADGERYDGAWKDDLPDGPGTLTRADGSVVKGVFRDGELIDATPDQTRSREKKRRQKGAARGTGLRRRLRQDAGRRGWLAHRADPDRRRHRTPDHRSRRRFEENHLHLHE